MLEARGLGKRFTTASGVVRAVEHVSFSLNRGEFLAVHGPSGCGKTTLLLITGALLKPDAGTVIVNGINPYLIASSRRAKFRAETLGFIFQQFHLVPYLDVLDNVLAPTLAAPFDGARERAIQLLVRFRLEHRLHHLPGALSTGERQRVALSRAALTSPPLLLADEPTGNLDNANARLVLDYFEQFAAAGGSVLLMTHDDRARLAAHRSFQLHGVAARNP